MATRPPKAPKAPKTPPPTAEAVAARLAALPTVGARCQLWKEAELKCQLQAKERLLVSAALARLRDERQVLALTQGKTTLYLFAKPLREWLGDGVAGAAGRESGTPTKEEDIFEIYARLVRQSGGFPDVRIAALGSAEGKRGEQLVALWREGRATFSQGDWSLADEVSREAAVELNGERYLLVRLE